MTEKATPPPVKPKRGRPRRIAIITGIVLGALVLAVVVVPLLVPESLAGRIAASRIQAMLGREAKVEGARFNVFSGFAARGVAIQRREGFGDGHLVTIGSVSGSVDYGALLGGTLRVTNIRVADLDAHLIRDRQGTLNVQDLLERPSGGALRLGQVQAQNVRVHLDDQEHGVAESVTVAEATLGAVVGGKRAVRANVSLGTGGQATVDGTVHVTPRTEELDHADIQLKATAIALGKMAARLLQPRLKGKLDLAKLGPLIVDADLTLGATGDRAFAAKGHVLLRELPPLPELGLEGPQRELKVSLDGHASPNGTDVTFAARTLPAEAVQATLRIDDSKKKKGSGALELENYSVDAKLQLALHAKNGIPATPVRAGRATLAATLKGTIEKLEATLSGALTEIAVPGPDGKLTTLPRITIDVQADGGQNGKGLLARITRHAIATEGITVEGTASVLRPPKSDVVSIQGTATTRTDFSKVPASLVQLLNVPVEGGTLAGLLKTDAAADFRVSIETTDSGWILRPSKINAKGSLGLEQFAVVGGRRPVPPSDLTAQANVVADVEKLSARFTDTSIAGSGITGTLGGALTLGGEEPAQLTGQLDVDLAEVVRRYGVLIGLPSDLEVAGKAAWHLDAKQTDATLAVLGAATLSDIRVGGPAWKGTPLVEPRAELAHNVTWNRDTGAITVRRLHLKAKDTEATVSGTVVLPGGQGKSDLTVELTADAARAAQLRGFLPAPLNTLAAEGKATVRAKVSGTPSDLAAAGTVSWNAGRLSVAELTTAGTVDYQFQASLKGGTKGTITATGKGTAQNALVALARPGVEPFRDPRVTFTHDVTLDLGARELAVADFQLRSKQAEVTAKGLLVVPGPLPADGSVGADVPVTAFQVDATVDTALAGLVRGLLPAHLADLALSGKATAAVSLKESRGPHSPYVAKGTVAWQGATVSVAGIRASGTLDYDFQASADLVASVFSATGSGKLRDAVLASPSRGIQEIRDPEATLTHDVRLDLAKGLLKVGNFSLKAKRAQVTAKGLLALPGGKAAQPAQFDFQATVDTSLAGLVRNALPKALADLTLAGTAEATFTVKQVLQPAEAITAQGSVRWKDARVRAAGIDASGSLAYDFDASWQPKEQLLAARGKGQMDNAVLASPDRGIKEFRDPRATFTHDVRLDLAKQRLDVNAFEAISQRARATAKGALLLAAKGQDTSRFQVNATADTSLVGLLQPLLPAQVADLKMTGEAKADLVVGTTPQRTTATGSFSWSQGTATTKHGAIAASLTSRIDAALEGTKLLLRGQGSLTDFAATTPRLGTKALREKSLALDYDLAADLEAKTASIQRLTLIGKLIQVACSGKATQKAIDLKLQGSAATDLIALVPSLPKSLNDLKLTGPAAFDLVATGSPTSPRLVGHIDGQAVAASLRDLVNKPAGLAARVAFDAVLSADAIALAQADIRVGSVGATARLKTGWDFAAVEGTVRADALDVAAAAALCPLAAEYRPTGKVAVDMAVTGSAKKPLLRGTVQLTECSAQLPKYPQLKATVQGSVVAAGTDASAEALSIVVAGSTLTVKAKATDVMAYPATTIDVAVASDRVDLSQILAAIGKAPAPGAPAVALPPTAGWTLGQAKDRPGALPPVPPRLPATGKAEALLPTLPPELKATFQVDVAEMLYDKRTMTEFHAEGALEKSVVVLAKATAKPMGGELAASGRVAFGGDLSHSIKLSFAKVPIDQDFDLLAKFPLFKIVTAMLGGMPAKFSFVAHLPEVQLAALGNDLDTLRQTATSKGQVVLTDVVVGGSPLFNLLATYTNHPELRTIRFERIDAPYQLAQGILHTTATMPYQEGAFFVQGAADLRGPIHYKTTVQKPRGITFLPEELMAYAEEGNAIVYIKGTISAPAPRIPTEDIIAYGLRRKFMKKDKKDGGRLDGLLDGILRRGGDNK